MTQLREAQVHTHSTREAIGRTQGDHAESRQDAGKAGDLEHAVRDLVRIELGDDLYARYFGQGVRLHASDSGVEVVAPTPFLAGVLDRRVMPAIRKVSATRGLDSALRVERGVAPAMSPTPSVRRRPPSPARRKPAEQRQSFPHSLEEFVVGASNRLAYNAAARIAEGVDDAAFSPLFIHGPAGVGKTHLLQGIARRFLERTPKARVKYTTAEAFTNEFVQAIGSRSMDKFRRAWRGVSLLCLDDVHFLGGKDGTQQELLHTLDAIGLRHARIVLASDEHPHKIAKCSTNLVNRFVGGAVVRIDEPDPDLCGRLSQEFARRRGFAMTPPGVDVLVAHARTGRACSVRELEGLLTQVGAVRRLLLGDDCSKAPIDAEGVRRALQAGEGRHQEKAVVGPHGPVRFESILRGVCEQMRVTREDLFGKGRHRRVVLARGFIVTLARELTTMSYPEIAKGLRRPNHSTVITAFKRLAGQIEQGDTPACGPDLGEVPLGELLDRLRASVTGGVPARPRD